MSTYGAPSCPDFENVEHAFNIVSHIERRCKT